MKTNQLIWEDGDSWESYEDAVEITPQLVLFFGSTSLLEEQEYFQQLQEMYPKATLVGCTTAGEIIGDEVLDDSIVATAIEFEQTNINSASILIGNTEGSLDAGRKLGKEIQSEQLKSVLVISDGGSVNGSELVEGLTEVLGSDIIITGGLAGDGGRFEKTLVAYNQTPEQGRIVVIGFEGDAVQVGHGSVGGWDAFGPERKITRSEANVLYELDGKPALELYKGYLGDKASELPGSALLFPLMIRPSGQEEVGTVRTILSVNEEDQSMTFAGDVPEGYSAQLMMANFDRLVAGASEAAKFALNKEEAEMESDTLAILISCVGRKMVLGQRTADEVESVMDIMGGAKQIGFYSYGEISPHVEVGNCQLHNQTMTITSITEKV
ncbi:MAG: FIST N-terminal domain-containing protein [Bacteroidota bacterium]